MTAGPLENKRGEPSLVEKKIHEELKQLRVRPPADGACSVRLLINLQSRSIRNVDSRPAYPTHDEWTIATVHSRTRSPATLH